MSLEDLEQMATSKDSEADIDQQRSLQKLAQLILKLKPLDRQIMLSYLEEIDASTIAEITGLSPRNVSMKVHRIKSILARHFIQEQPYV